MYQRDPSIPIPRTTAYRKRLTTSTMSTCHQTDGSVMLSRSHSESTSSVPSSDSFNTQAPSILLTNGFENLNTSNNGTSDNLNKSNNYTTNASRPVDCDNIQNETFLNILGTPLENTTHYTENSESFICSNDYNNRSCGFVVFENSQNKTCANEEPTKNDTITVNERFAFPDDQEELSDDESLVYTDSDSEPEIETEIETSSDSDTDCDDDTNICTTQDQVLSKMQCTSNKNFTHEEEKSMALLALLLRYHLGDNGSQDLVKIMNIFNPDCEVKDPNKLKEIIGSTDTKIYEFCDRCYTLFPEDDNVFQCSLEGCNNLRFKGTFNKQNLKRKKAYFTCLLVQQQIQDILQREGMWSAMSKYRTECAKADKITDILNADAYKELCKSGEFMFEKDNFTLLFNTDGVPLFKSSGVSIWPIYLVINELPPVMRFSRRNMIIWGVWQSKGKPVFRTFLQPFIEHMNQLRTDGLIITVQGREILTRGMLLASTMDLQAKAYLADMTQHNGKHGCITCEDPGEVVKQGRGHTRVYPCYTLLLNLQTDYTFL